jgi:DNA-binding MarR family transcriptional regulator
MEGPRNSRKRTVRFLTEEIDNAAACLSASRTVICQEVGLRHEHWKALEAIGRSPLTLSISALARRLRRSRQAVYSLALGLERAGWIRLLPNQDDRRLLQIEMTAHGMSILTTIENRFDAWLLTMAFDLGERELRHLANTLRAVRGRIARARDYAEWV